MRLVPTEFRPAPLANSLNLQKFSTFIEEDCRSWQTTRRKDDPRRDRDSQKHGKSSYSAGKQKFSSDKPSTVCCHVRLHRSWILSFSLRILRSIFRLHWRPWLVFRPIAVVWALFRARMTPMSQSHRLVIYGPGRPTRCWSLSSVRPREPLQLSWTHGAGGFLSTCAVIRNSTRASQPGF